MTLLRVVLLLPSTMTHDLVNIFVVSDGHGQDFWSLGLDNSLQINDSELDRSLRQACRMGQATQLALSTVAASFGSRVGLVHVAVADTLQKVNDSRNVARHHFDVVHIGERPLSPVVAVAGNLKLRAQAAKLAVVPAGTRIRLLSTSDASDY